MPEAVRLPRPGRHRAGVGYWALRAFVRVAIAFFTIGGRLKVEGAAGVPRSGGLLVVSNHIAAADPPLLGGVFPRPLHFMAKAEWFRNPVLGGLGRAFLCFPVVRHSADRNALRFTLDLLARGEAVCVYPEGTRSRDLRMKAPEAGAGFLARRSGAPILPVATWGGESVLPTGARFPRPASSDVHIVYGEPFTLPAEVGDNQRAAELMMSRVAELLPESYRGYFQDWAPGDGGRPRSPQRRSA